MYRDRHKKSLNLPINFVVSFKHEKIDYFKN